ncbi:MAG: phage head-tail connector protein [Rickettsiaceae bacterium H1]|nr:phage head-tail connector protein [Rickettsiaceae bacterium H1]
MKPNYNLYLKRLKTYKEPPISILQVKKFLNIEDNYRNRDSLLADLLNIATEYAEWYTEKSFMKQEWKILCIGNIPKRIYLPFGPIIKVKKVKCQNQTLLDNDDYSVEIIGKYIEFHRLGYYGRVEIIYTASNKTPEEVPSLIKEGILQHVSYAYHNRNDSQLISDVKKLYEQFREIKLTI